MAKTKRRTRWGTWTLTKHWTLQHDDPKYNVRLSECNDSAEILDWIAQIAKKTWGTPLVLGNLAKALCDILDPQSACCGEGVNSEFDAKERAKHYLRSVPPDDDDDGRPSPIGKGIMKRFAK